MSNQSPNHGQPGRFIRGPQSALTDFLASHNISASRIQSDAAARRAAAPARRSSDASASAAASGQAQDDEVDNVVSDRAAATTARRARDQKRKKQEEAIDKIKKSRAYKRRRGLGSESDNDLALALLSEKMAPLPGQMSNCEVCGKRFTVTPYTRSGPEGGLVCVPCGKELAKDEDANKKPNKKRAAAAPKGGVGRRKIQSRILDGTYYVGAKPLMTLCIEKLANNIDLADDLGDLPQPVIDRIARLLSKSRLLDARTLNLFLQSHHETINVYDAAKLSSDDFIKIFQFVPQLKNLKLRNAIQFTDRVMQYLADRNISLESIYIHGANLLGEDMWIDFLTRKGPHLKSLQVYYTDRHFSDNAVGQLSELCPNLSRLKICHNQQLSDKGIRCIATVDKLEHLSLQCIRRTTTDPYVHVINTIGRQLQTFSIRNVADVDDRLLDAIHENCINLSKLRITDSEFMTDAGFARLFRGWKNKPLEFLDLQKCRHVDSGKPRDNEHKIGLCSEGFEALMEHSGNGLRYLNIHACRHISRETFEKVFSNKIYANLRYLEISFCEHVNDFIVGSIFRCCPSLQEVNVFGCMKVKDVRVPRGKILVGVPNAVGMRIEGVDD
ncbi:hypothetical protein F5Y14DRAFT_373070 [Nemania sp. NC0429]|nr:hypothetical protein F5Y14DRAFT_373070 [Nemania sp. NC0429]